MPGWRYWHRRCWPKSCCSLASLYFFVATRDHIHICGAVAVRARGIRWRAAHVFRDVETTDQHIPAFGHLRSMRALGVAVTLTLWALGVPSPITLGGAGGGAQLHSYVGQGSDDAAPACRGARDTADAGWTMLLAAVAYGRLNLIADQIVIPHFMGRAMTLNPFVILVGSPSGFGLGARGWVRGRAVAAGDVSRSPCCQASRCRRCGTLRRTVGEHGAGPERDAEDSDLSVQAGARAPRKPAISDSLP